MLTNGSFWRIVWGWGRIQQPHHAIALQGLPHDLPFYTGSSLSSLLSQIWGLPFGCSCWATTFWNLVQAGEYDTQAPAYHCKDCHMCPFPLEVSCRHWWLYWEINLNMCLWGWRLATHGTWGHTAFEDSLEMGEGCNITSIVLHGLPHVSLCGGSS